MNDFKFASSKRDRIPFAPIIEGGVEPKTLKLSAQWIVQNGQLICQWGKCSSDGDGTATSATEGFMLTDPTPSLLQGMLAQVEDDNRQNTVLFKSKA